VGSNLGDGRCVDERPEGDTPVQAVTDLEAFHRRLQLLDERVIDAVVHIEAIGANAGLAVVAVLRGHGARDGGIEVRVLEDDERRIAAQFERELLDVVGALRHQHATDRRGAREAQLADDRIAGQLPADRMSITRDDVEHAPGNSGALGQVGQRESGERRLRRRLQHHGAARGQRRRNLARDHCAREVPGRDRGRHADRLLENQQLLARLRRRNHVAVDPLAFLGEPLHVGGRVLDLAARFGQWLALLGGDQPREFVLVLQDQLEPCAKLGSAFLRREQAPGRKRLVRGVDGAPRFVRAHEGDGADQASVSRVVDRLGLPAVGFQPLACDERTLPEQRQVLHAGTLTLLRKESLRTIFWFLNSQRSQPRIFSLRPSVVVPVSVHSDTARRSWIQ
jgi:hypothetical protein